MSGFLLIFDLDGTLVDSVPDLTASLNEVLSERGHAPLTVAEVKPMIGDGVPMLVARGFAARGAGPDEAAAAMPRYTEIYEANATNTSRPYQGVAETLAGLRLAGYRTAVCSNKPQRACEIMLRELGIAGLFDGVAGGDRFAVRKPHPGHLLGLIEALGGDAARTAMIGDSENDAASAHAAGLPLLLMGYGYARGDIEALGARRVLAKFADLPATLVELGLAP
ncbi:MAG TPA: phosphoglycolate phosphatase [Stellaceae bacterium]|jgi:phosphoglycolate phosphatase|nr:phosphoglycolate phosphatase [Stellaceae bacterium]